MKVPIEKTRTIKERGFEVAEFFKPTIQQVDELSNLSNYQNNE